MPAVKSTAELKKNGGYVPSRHKNRADTAPAPGYPAMPKGLDKSQRELWQRICEGMPKPCLGMLDSEGLLEAVTVFKALKKLRPKVVRDPLDKEVRVAYCHYFDRWMRISDAYGLTPLARSRLKVPEPDKKEDGMAALMGRLGGGPN